MREKIKEALIKQSKEKHHNWLKPERLEEVLLE